MALPVCVADYHGPATARLHFFCREETTGDRLNGKGAKELRTYRGHSFVLRRGACHHRRFTRDVVSHRLEGGTLVVPILEVRNRDLLGKRGGGLTGRRKIGKSHNPIWIAIGQRPEKYGVHDAKNGCIGSNSERHNQNVGTGLKEQQFCRFSEQRPIGGDAVKNSIAVSISEKKMKTLGSNFLKF